MLLCLLLGSFIYGLAMVVCCWIYILLNLHPPRLIPTNKVLTAEFMDSHKNVNYVFLAGCAYMRKY